MAGWRDVLDRVARVGRDLFAPAPRAGRRPPSPRGAVEDRGVRTVPAAERARRISYAPDMDGAADPGEIVWTWVPYEEDPRQGKDRPVLVVARDGSGGDLLGLMLSSQGRRADDDQWLGIGSGPWDRQGRDSYVRLDRVLEFGEHGIRREGAVVPRDRFDRVAAALRSGYGWR